MSKILTSSVDMIICEEIADYECKIKILKACEDRLHQLTEAEKQAVMDHNYDALNH